MATVPQPQAKPDADRYRQAWCISAVIILAGGGTALWLVWTTFTAKTPWDQLEVLSTIRVADLIESEPESTSDQIDSGVLTDEDCEVLDVVLSNLVEWDAFPDVDTKSGGQIVVDTKTPFSPTSCMLDESQIRSETNRLEPIPDEVLLNLRERNSESVSLTPFKPSNPTRVTLHDLEFEVQSLEYHAERAWLAEHFPRAKATLSVYLPGYSKNHRVALVRFGGGPCGCEGVAGTYLLFKDDTSNWKVKWRRIAHLTI